MLLWWTHSMGIHGYEDCDENCIVLESFIKNGWICDLCWNDVVDSSFIWIWVSFYVYNCLDKLWEPIWALGNQKLRFWGKNGFFPESIVAEFCHNSPRWVKVSWGWVLPMRTHLTSSRTCNSPIFRYFVFNYFMYVYLCLYVIIYSWLYFLGFSDKEGILVFWWERVK